MVLKMKLMFYLSCLFIVVNTGSRYKRFCYDLPRLSCAEEHILDCNEGQIISTDISNFRVGFFRNRNYPECVTENNECKNKTACCTYINSRVTEQGITLKAANNTPLINFIKTECSSKSSCIVSMYYNTSGGSNLYDFVTYNYGCIPVLKENITANFLVNSTQFIGNNFPTLYYLDYTGNRSKEGEDVILNRECIVTTTKGDITLTIKELNLQADDCCRVHITRYNVSEYCSLNGSFIPPIRERTTGKNSATIRLENVVNKDGDSFSIIVEAAGNVTVDCRTIEHDNKQGPITCQQPTPQSSSTSESTISTTSPSITQTKESIRESTIEKEETIYSESDLAVIIGGTVGGLVLLNIIVIIIVVVIVRRKLQTKQTTNETQYYSSLDGLSPEHNYSGMETTSSSRAQT